MSNIIYTKYSNERARRFALRTDIVQEGANRLVQKQALYPEGEGHIQNISRWYQELGHCYQGTRIGLNRCGLSEDGLRLEYLEGQTLEQILDGYLLAGNITQLEDSLFEYLEEVKKGFTLEGFEVTPGFEEVFGKVLLPSELLCGSVTDIDMVLNNVLVNQEWTLIDYEWTFGFPIPYHFVVYRILYYYLNGNITRNCLHELDLYEKAGLSEEELEIYKQMEHHFQGIYVTSEVDGDQYVPLRELYEVITPGTMELSKLLLQEQNEARSRMVQLYQSPTLDFSEERSEWKKLHKEGAFLNCFSIESDARYVRLDPCSKYCVLRNLQMQWGKEIRNYRTNGIVQKDGSIFFPMDDPQIIVERPEGAIDDFRAYFEVTYLNKEDALDGLRSLYSRQREELSRTKATLGQREALIHEIENTKVWKAYRKIKRN